jgi:hypothetical protein
MEPTRVYGIWSAEFLNRRMEEHRRFQHATEKRLIEEIIDEVQTLPKRQSRCGMLLEFESAGFSSSNLKRVVAQ